MDNQVERTGKIYIARKEQIPGRYARYFKFFIIDLQELCLLNLVCSKYQHYATLLVAQNHFIRSALLGSFKCQKIQVGSSSPRNLKFNQCNPLILQLKQMKPRHWVPNLLKVSQLVNGHQLNWRKLNNLPKVTALATGRARITTWEIPGL